MTSLEWTPGAITGVIASECIAETRQEVDLPVYGGHFSQSVPALLDAIRHRRHRNGQRPVGRPSTTSASFVQGGETNFTLTVPDEKAVHELEITAELTAALNVPLPPMLQTTHHPARTDVYTRRVTCRCGESSTTKTVRIRVHHPEHVRAVETERGAGHPLQGGDHCPGPHPDYGPGPVPGPGRRRPLRGAGGARSHPRAAQGGADHGGRFLLVGVSVVGRIPAILLSPAAALVSVAAGTTGEKKAAMQAAFDNVLTGMAYAGVGLCFFALVWAGFVLMAEGAEGEGQGQSAQRRDDGRGRPGGGAAGQGHRRRHQQPHHPGISHPIGQKGVDDYETDATQPEGPEGPGPALAAGPVPT